MDSRESILMRRSSPSTIARWPFWLLLAAWFCANSPQILTYELVEWVGSARQFTHQQRLTNQVVGVLTGDTPVNLTAAPVDLAHVPFAPAVPADATLQKINLALPESVELFALTSEPNIRSSLDYRGALGARAAPPDEPPRQRS